MTQSNRYRCGQPGPDAESQRLGIPENFVSFTDERDAQHHYDDPEEIPEPQWASERELWRRDVNRAMGYCGGVVLFSVFVAAVAWLRHWTPIWLARGH